MTKPSIVLVAAVAGAAAAVAVILAGVGRSDAVHPRTAHIVPVTDAAFPLHMSANHRYLVDRKNRPFLLVGDSPQALVGDLTTHDAAVFIANRQSYDINALWVNLLCAKYTGCADDGTTRDGVAPFTRKGDLTTPNPLYFDRAEAMVRLAARAGMVVLLDPIETGSWLTVLRANGPAKAYAYGRFLGRRFRALPNIVWLNGNDFQSWRSEQDDALVLAVARGIRSVDTTHIQTVELNYEKSASLDDERWRPLIQLDAAYSYGPTYAEVLHAYNQRQPLPVVMVEAGYESEQNLSSFSKGDPPILRRQEYWSALSGASGQLYGNHYTWQFASGWQNHLDTTGSRELRYMARLLHSLPWYRLVPDQRHRLVTGGSGSYRTDGNVGSSSYATTAATSDGRYALSYLPDGGTIRVAMSRLVPGLRARWYDPTTGTYRPASGRGAAHSTSFTAPADNGAGDPDWVLVIGPR